MIQRNQLYWKQMPLITPLRHASASQIRKADYTPLPIIPGR